MDIFKFEKANCIANVLLPAIKNIREYMAQDEIYFTNRLHYIGKSLETLCNNNEEFVLKFNQLLSETEARLNKEFKEL